MDLVQIFGDYSKVLGMVMLLMKILLTKNCSGISFKTQLLYVLIAMSRYIDVYREGHTLYSRIMKIAFIILPVSTAISMIYYKKTCDIKYDRFRIMTLIVPCAVLALFQIGADQSSFFEDKFWSFSIYMEAVAIIPQIYLVTKKRQVESIVVSYICALGLYRGFYMLHWIYQYYIGHFDDYRMISAAASIVQIFFYADFFAKNLPTLKTKYANGHSCIGDQKRIVHISNVCGLVSQKEIPVRDLQDVKMTGNKNDKQEFTSSPLNSVVFTLPKEEKDNLLAPKDVEKGQTNSPS